MKKGFLILISVLFISRIIVAQELKPFKKAGLWGFLDSTGKEIITPKYQYVGKFQAGYAVVEKNDSLGIIDAHEKIIIPFKYQYLKYIGNQRFLFGYRSVYFGEYKIGVISSENKIIIQANFKSITPSHQYYYIVNNPVDSVISKGSLGDVRSIRSKIGLYNFNGKELIPTKFDYIQWVSDSLLAATKNNTAALFNYKGIQLTKFNYKVIGNFNEGLSKVRSGDKFGYIDKSGKEVISCQFDLNYLFTDGYAVVWNKKKFGIIDKEGTMVIPYLYDRLGLFSNSLISADKKGKWGLINIKGEIIIPFEYDEKIREYQGAIALKKNGKWHIFNQLKMKIENTRYDEVVLPVRGWDEETVKNFGTIPDKKYTNSLLLVRIGDKWGLVDDNSKQITEISYSFQEAFNQITLFR